jgi:3-oxoacyl-[acyl-carrier-protein] synthase-3
VVVDPSAGERLMRAVIEGVGHAVPETSLSTHEVAARVSAASGFRLDPHVIVRLSGVERRRCAEPGQTPSALGAMACRRALADANRSVGDIDLVVSGSITQDMAEPSVAALIQDRVGCAEGAAFDVKNGCNGFLSALDLARSLIEAGAHRLALVVAAEVLTPQTEWSLEDTRQLATRFASFTVGDAAGALVVGPGDGRWRGVGAGVFVSDGRHWRLCASTAEDSRMTLTTDSVALERVVIERVPPLVHEVLAAQGWTGHDIDVCVPHQASVPALERTSRLLDIPFDRCVVTAREYGNTAAASIPLALSIAKRRGRLRAGSRVVLIGGASGFSGGVMPVVW